MKFLAVVLAIALSGCVVNSVVPGEGADMNIDFSKVGMRHGWTEMTPAKRTVIGVNDANSIERGRKLFSQHCQKCHGANGDGKGPMAKELGIRPANLKNLARNVPNYYLVVQINDGRDGGMPKWRDFLTSEQSWDLTNFIQTLQDKKK
ncbi:MAG: cytochrome c [Bdellovibrionales bacterium]|nr:cytochrome c [Bdellovibrionales bacterium]